MRIYAIHLLNDFSGSPKVLMQLANGWLADNKTVTLVTGGNNKGFLSEIKDARYLYFPYKFATNRLTRLLNYLFSQFTLFFMLLKHLKREDLVYVNTILPFGAALAGKLKKCRVIYHIHETSVKPVLLKRFLFKLVKLTASDVIYVSNYLASQENISGVSKHVLFNAIEDKFLSTARAFVPKNTPEKNILMICSLKAYKGVDEFVALAKAKPDYSFHLVVNASLVDINQYFNGRTLPSNLTVFPTQNNTHPFYQWADVVLNLSRPDEWVETFGLTVIEAMCYGLPVIVPPVGGITELVDEGFNGYRIDGRDTAYLAFKLGEIFENKLNYKDMRKAAFYKVGYFKEKTFILKNLAIINQVKNSINKEVPV